VNEARVTLVRINGHFLSLAQVAAYDEATAAALKKLAQVLGELLKGTGEQISGSS
jgi:hypothetical protein